VLIGVGEQRQEARALDRHRQLTLVEGLGARDAARYDLAGLGDVILQRGEILVVDLLDAVCSKVSVPVIASGGVGSLQHLAEGVLEGHADAVLAASIFHFGEFTVREAKEHMAKQGIEVRL